MTVCDNSLIPIGFIMQVVLRDIKRLCMPSILRIRDAPYRISNIRICLGNKPFSGTENKITMTIMQEKFIYKS